MAPDYKKDTRWLALQRRNKEMGGRPSVSGILVGLVPQRRRSSRTRPGGISSCLICGRANSNLGPIMVVEKDVFSQGLSRS